jgi:hypothetical protein
VAAIRDQLAARVIGERRELAAERVADRAGADRKSSRTAESIPPPECVPAR